MKIVLEDLRASHQMLMELTFAYIAKGVDEHLQEIYRIEDEIKELLTKIPAPKSICELRTRCDYCVQYKQCVWCTTENRCVGGNDRGCFFFECDYFMYETCAKNR